MCVRAPVSEQFPIVSDRARKRGSVFWSSEPDVRGERKGTSTGAVSDRAGMKRESVLWKRNWICAASVGKPAQALVSDLFPLVSDRAAIKKESVLWSRGPNLHSQCGENSAGACSDMFPLLSDRAGVKRGSVLPRPL